MPRVSVIIPTYNRAHLLGRSIQSVLNQTYRDFEIIIVDDGSTDNSEEVIKGFKDSRIRYVYCKENKGYPVALNRGLKVAKGQYIAFQDSDDEWLPEKLEKQMKVFDAAPPEVGVVYTGLCKIKQGKKSYVPYFKVIHREGNIRKELFKCNFVCTPTSVVRKECFKKVGVFDEDLPNLQDWELWIRISKYYNFKYVDEALVISYYTSDSISSNQQGFINALQLIAKKHIKDFKKYRKLLAKHYCVIGTMLRLNGKMGEGRKYFIKTILAHPFSKFSLIAFISFFGSRSYNMVRDIKRLIVPGGK